MRPLTVFAASALALLLAVPVQAETVTLDGVTLDLPEGWEQQDATAGTLMFTRTFPETEDTDQASALVQLIRTTGNMSSFSANFDEIVLLAVPELRSEDPMTESAGTNVQGHQVRTEYRCCDSSRDISIGQTAVGIGGENEQVFLTMVFVNISSDHQETADADFANIVRSVRLNGDGDQAFAPQSGDGGLEGAYTNLYTGVMPNMFGGMDFISESRILYFEPNGLYATELPSGDLAEHCAQTPLDCGTYRLGGGGWFGGHSSIELRSVVDEYGTIETEAEDFAREGDNVRIGDTVSYRIPPFPAGTTFEGSWTYLWAQTGMTATSSGSVASEQTLELRADGRYSRDGWSGASTSTVTVSSDRAAQNGTYSIEGHQITLTADNGEVQTMSIFAPDDDDGLLVINGANYLKND